MRKHHDKPASIGMGAERRETVHPTLPETTERREEHAPERPLSERLKKRATDFWRKHFKGEVMPAYADGAHGWETQRDIIEETAAHVAEEFMHTVKGGVMFDVAKFLSQEIHEAVEERKILHAYADALAGTGIEFGLAPQETDLEAARKAVRQRIEDSVLMTEDQKWDLLRNLSSLMIAEDGEFRSIDAEALAEIKKAIVHHVETPIDGREVLQDVAIAASATLLFPFEMLELAKVGYKSIRYVRTGVEAHRRAGRRKAA